MQKRDVLVEALHAAATAVLACDPLMVEAKTKANTGDLVTTADIASEKIIIDTIKATFPGELVISEEMKEGQEKLTPASLPSLTGWVIDPIDGTNNFKRGMAYSGISIGYIEKGVIILEGIINPFRGDLYIAERGGGATCNNLSIKVAGNTDFDPGTRVCTSNSYEGGTQANLERYAKLGRVWVDVLGSAVLIMTDVASGKLDLYHHNGLKPWDNAAGFLIATEDGAKIAGLHGQPVSWLTNEVVMGNPALVDLFVERLNA